MPRFLVLLIYNSLLPFLLLFGMPGYIVKGIRRGGLRKNFAQRFGKLPEAVRSLREKPVWFHAVSVGEVLVAAKIIRALRSLEPEQPVVLTTTTTTGYRVAENELRELGHFVVIHNPVDLPPVVRSVVRQIRPAKLVLVEAEIWPNVVRHLKGKGIPVLLANARLSPRSESRYRKFAGLIRPVFGMVDRTAVPFSADVERWSALGMGTGSISVLGSVKFDESIGSKPAETIAELSRWLDDTGCPEDRMVFLAGSTHAGEEEICCRVWRELLSRHPRLVPVIVPRHAERAPEIAATLKRQGFDPVFRSSFGEGEDVARTAPEGNARVWISDTTGELRAWFHLADVVFMGKSLTGKGGQNPVEPVLAGKPVIVGPHTRNFREVIGDLAEKAGIVRVESEEELAGAVDRLLTDPEEARRLAENGSRAMEAHRGAALRTARWILDRE